MRHSNLHLVIMTAPIQNKLVVGWNPFRQWIPAGIILIAGWVAWFFKADVNFSFYCAYIALLLFSFMSAVINAMRANLLKNMAISVPLYIAHAYLCYLLLMKVQDRGMDATLQLFMAILVFYVMATILGILFRSIYVYIAFGAFWMEGKLTRQHSLNTQISDIRRLTTDEKN
ncbi:MAG: hypothetical protein GY751_07500 [Bacteroidetes bacterium]|nr:hypothetical protein [Bacteroidota bacterium]